MEEMMYYDGLSDGIGMVASNGSADMGGLAMIFMALAGLQVFLVLLGVVLKVLFDISFGKIFEKAGVAWWKSLIPGYNIYVYFKDVLKRKYWLIYILVAVIFPLLCLFTGSPELMMIGPVLSVGIAALLYIVTAYRTAKVFGKSFRFSLGLMIFPYVFYPILALGDAEYVNEQAPTPEIPQAPVN